MKIGLFIYDFPHLRSEKFLVEISKYAKIDLALAAPFKELGLPKPSYDISSNKAEVSPLVTCQILCIPYVIAPHNSKKTIRAIKEADLDIGIIAGARILSREVIDAFNVGVINFHSGILPHNRGLDAMRWAIYNYWHQCITVHWIDERVDAGYEIFSEFVDVYVDDTMKDISKRLLKVQINLIERLIKSKLNTKLLRTTSPKINVGDCYPHSMMGEYEERIVLKQFEEYKRSYRK